MTDPRLLALFQDEAHDHLDTMERCLLQFEKGDRSVIEECLRRAHTLKGAARVVGHSAVENICHAFEEMMAPARKGEAVTCLRELLERIDEMRRCCDREKKSEHAGDTANPGLEPAEVLRVESERFDRMMRLVSSLRIGREKPDRAAYPERARRLAEEDILLEQLDRELRSARLLPLATLALSLERTIREIASERGLHVAFTLEGGDVALDRAAIDALREPLLHLVRNALAHGIESPEERLLQGKKDEALIRISAERMGNRCRIMIEDDGRGVDVSLLKISVRDAGLLTERELESLAQDQLLDLVFRPSISTTVAIDSISGRGVGLEIVRSRLRAARGEARLLSTGPSGTIFLLELPVHLQILHVLVVRASGGLFGIPSGDVKEVCRMTERDVRIVDGVAVVVRSEQTIRVVDLGQALDDRAVLNYPGRDYLLLGASGRSVALRVDEVVGESEVLLRDLGFPIAGLSPYSGAALTEEGSIVLVVHPVELVERALRARTVPRPQSALRKKILVADDSATTRTLLRGVLVAAGYDVATAGDGMEASRMLRSSGAEIVVSDIEMPLMDGYELTRAVKSASRGRIPVVLVTARESEDDRRKGLDAGADAYIVKSSFESEGLLAAVRRLS
ncbi:MAG: response regulator [Candidatus Hydrogenedentota bacterium]